MKKIVYFKKIEEITPKSEYTNLITNIFGRRLDVYSEEGAIYVLTDPKLAYLTKNIDEIMELEMNNIVFKHISCKEVQIDNQNKTLTHTAEDKKNETEVFEESLKCQKNSIVEDKIKNSKNKIEEIREIKGIIKNNENLVIEDKIEKESINETIITDSLPIVEEKNEKLELKTDNSEKSIKLAKRKEREEKEKIMESLENKKTEKNFGMKETFAVLFTILFALINVYLLILLNGNDK